MNKHQFKMFDVLGKLGAGITPIPLETVLEAAKGEGLQCAMTHLEVLTRERYIQNVGDGLTTNLFLIPAHRLHADLGTLEPLHFAPFPCSTCDGSGAVYDGSGEVPLPNEGQVCPTCWYQGVCPNCGRWGWLDEHDNGDNLYEAPCTFCGWTYCESGMRPAEGMGATKMSGSDRYAFTVLTVVNDNTAILIPDEARKIRDRGEWQDYAYWKNTDGPTVTVSRRKDGKWRIVGQDPVVGHYFIIGRREERRDPCR